MVAIVGRITTDDGIFGVRECCKCQYVVQADKQIVCCSEDKLMCIFLLLPDRAPYSGWYSCRVTPSAFQCSVWR